MAAIEIYALTRESFNAVGDETVAMSYSICASQSSWLICMEQQTYHEKVARDNLFNAL